MINYRNSYFIITVYYLQNKIEIKKVIKLAWWSLFTFFIFCAFCSTVIRCIHASALFQRRFSIVIILAVVSSDLRSRKLEVHAILLVKRDLQKSLAKVVLLRLCRHVTLDSPVSMRSNPLHASLLSCRTWKGQVAACGWSLVPLGSFQFPSTIMVTFLAI